MSSMSSVGRQGKPTYNQYDEYNAVDHQYYNDDKDEYEQYYKREDDR